MTSEVAQHLTGHLRRADGQEDCCFVLWRPSTGASRTTALLTEMVLPREGERIVHETVDFTSAYFLRAAALAAERGCGLGFIHARPKGRGWQRLNSIDHKAEASFAAQTQVITSRPLVGLTFAGTDAGFGARIWQQQARRRYAPTEAESIRVAGGRLTVTFNNRLLPPPRRPRTGSCAPFPPGGRQPRPTWPACTLVSSDAARSACSSSKPWPALVSSA